MKRGRFEPVGPVLVRASTYPGGLDTATPPDVVDPRAGLAWLASQWARPEVREGISIASPDLATRVSQLLDPGESDATPKALRRAVLATASYLLRWQRRSTPFGLFAAVTTASIGPAKATIGDRHHAIARADGEWLTLVVEALEAHHELRTRLAVVADNGGFVRDGRFIVAGRPQLGQRPPGLPRETSIKYTRAVALAIAHAARPIRFDQLAAHLAAEAPHAAVATIEAMVHALVDGGFLITSLRPPTTVVDALAYVLDTLRAVGAAELTDLAPTLDQLASIHAQLVRHNLLADQTGAAQLRAAATESMACLAPRSAHQLAVDLRLDAQFALPRRVLDEAARAADVLLRTSAQPFGSIAWLDYHARFRDRYGPGALVPVRDLVADSGLGYPTGFLGTPRARPAWRMVTERDAHLMTLVQAAILDGADEIRLSDADVDALTVGEHATAVPPSRIELGVAVCAASTGAVDRGDFELQITGAPRTPTSMVGRFAYLLDQAERDQLAGSFGAPAHHGGAGEVLAVQLSFPPRRVHNQNVVRVGALLPNVVSLSEHPATDTITVDDFAVTADAEQMYLVHRPTGRRVVPHIPHALDLTVQTPPLARFLAEVADARSAVFGPFDYGAAARTLPYLPRIRYRRIVLAPARWLLNADALTAPGPDGSMATAVSWSAALDVWRRRWRVPDRVVACQGELRLPLDLRHPVERALLRAQLIRAGRVELREDAPAEGYQWLGRPAEFVITMTLTTPPVRRLPMIAAPGRTLYPGASTVLHAQLIGNPARADHLLTTHCCATPRMPMMASLRMPTW